MKLQELTVIANMYDVVFISGLAYSGKSSLAQEVKKFTTNRDVVVLSVGSIVRAITQQKQRVHDNTLDEEIANQLIQDIYLYHYQGKRVVVEGIRVWTIYHAVIKIIKHNAINYLCVWLEVDFLTLQERFKSARQDKDVDTSYEQIWKKDTKIGTLEVKKYLINNHSLIIVNNETFRYTADRKS